MRKFQTVAVFLSLGLWLGTLLYAMYLDSQVRHFLGLEKFDYLGKDAGINQTKTMVSGICFLLSLVVIVLPKTPNPVRLGVFILNTLAAFFLR